MADEQGDRRGFYGVIHRRTWQRSDFKALSFRAKGTYCYLRTCPQGSLIGIFRLHPDDVVEDTGLSRAQVAPVLRELEESCLIVRHERWVWLPDALATTPKVSVRNPNHVKAVRRAVELVPDSLASLFRNLYKPWFEGADDIPNVIDDHVPDHMTDHGYVKDVKDVKDVNHEYERTRQEEGTGETVVSLDDRLAELRRQAVEIQADAAAPLRRRA